jgi:hypothetical protein
MAGSEQKSGLVGRVKGKLHARKERSAEQARLAGELKRDRRTLDKDASSRSGKLPGEPWRR